RPGRGAGSGAAASGCTQAERGGSRQRHPGSGQGPQAESAEGNGMKNVLLPMLATRAVPFDSDQYLFEVKWDGVRALAAIENRRWRLWGRGGNDYTQRYPELDMLRRLPSGTIVDGELIALKGGRADFPALLQRHQRNPASALSPAGRPVSIHYV